MNMGYAKDWNTQKYLIGEALNQNKNRPNGDFVEKYINELSKQSSLGGMTKKEYALAAAAGIALAGGMIALDKATDHSISSSIQNTDLIDAYKLLSISPKAPIALGLLGASLAASGCANMKDKAASFQEEANTKAQNALGQESDPYGTENALYKLLEKQMGGEIVRENIAYPLIIKDESGNEIMEIESADYLLTENPADLMRHMGDSVYDCTPWLLARELNGLQEYDTNILFPVNSDGTNDLVIDGKNRKPEVSLIVTPKGDVYPLYNQAYVDKYAAAGFFARDSELVDMGVEQRCTIEKLNENAQNSNQPEGSKFFEYGGSAIREIIPDTGIYTTITPIWGGYTTDSFGTFGLKNRNVEIGIDIQRKENNE